MHRLLETPWAPFESRPARLGTSRIALADLEETDDAFTLEVELPGIDTSDIEVEVEGRRVIVTAERREREREGTLRRRTRVTGQLRHEVVLPADIEEDAVEANLDQGGAAPAAPEEPDHEAAPHRDPLSLTTRRG